MTINLKDYANKLVVATLRNEWRIVSLVHKNGGEYDYKCFPYSIDGKNYSNDGRVLITAESPYDIIDIKLVDEDACKTPEETKMTINLKDYEGKFVVVTLRNEWRIVSTVYTNLGYYDGYPYSIDGKNYSNDGRVLITAESPYDIIDIKLVDEDPEPVITRVEVITDNGREYVSWEKDNKITTSLQDDGRTLKIFVNTKTTEETMYPKQPKPINMVEIESKRWATALSGLIDELGGDSPALWEWAGITPTPEKVVECLRENIQYLQQLASDEELEACLGLIAKRYSGCNYEGIDTAKEISTWMRNTRRPQPTLKSQALKDFEAVRKHSDELALLPPEILDNIEKALKSIPDT